MKRVIFISVDLVMILATVMGCSEYVVPPSSINTGESITPEQMVEISKEMQQTEAPPVESSTIESSISEPVQTEVPPVESSAIESSVAEPVQTEVPPVESSAIESSIAEPVQTEVPPVESSTIESSYVEPSPSDTTAPPNEPAETTTPSTTTAGSGNETPIVPMETTHASSTDDNIQGGVVYWTPGGSVWHTSDKCSSLSRSKEILTGSEADARAAGKERVCKRCG